MKKVDENVRMKMLSSEDNSSGNYSQKGGALQNRLSAKCESVNDIQRKTMGGLSNDNMKDEQVKSESENPTIVRNGYGVQYWTDGAHYEGQW